jgi:hypothetical protein
LIGGGGSRSSAGDVDAVHFCGEQEVRLASAAGM